MTVANEVCFRLMTIISVKAMPIITEGSIKIVGMRNNTVRKRFSDYWKSAIIY